MKRLDQQELEKFRAVYGTELLDGYRLLGSLPVSSSSSSTAHPARRSVLVFAGETELKNNMLPKELFKTNITCRLEHELTDSDVERIVNSPALKAALSELSGSASGPSLSKIHYKNCLPEMVGRDKAHWEPSLGERGIYSISREQLSRFQSAYTLSVQCDHPVLSKELHEFVERKLEKHASKPYSVGQFAASRIFTAARALAIRNTQQVAARLMDAMELTGTLQVSVDDQALPRLDAALPRIVEAQPNISVTLFNHLVDGFWEGGAAKATVQRRPAVAVYTDCGNPRASYGSPVVPLNPIEGMLLLKGVNSQDLRDELFNIESMQYTLPCGTGHSSEKHTPATPAAAKELQRYVSTCIGAFQASSHAELQNHPRVQRAYHPSAALVQAIATQMHNSQPTVLEHVFSLVR